MECRTPMIDTDHHTEVMGREILTVPTTGVLSAAAAACSSPAPPHRPILSQLHPWMAVAWSVIDAGVCCRLLPGSQAPGRPAPKAQLPRPYIYKFDSGRAVDRGSFDMDWAQGIRRKFGPIWAPIRFGPLCGLVNDLGRSSRMSLFFLQLVHGCL